MKKFTKKDFEKFCNKYKLNKDFSTKTINLKGVLNFPFNYFYETNDFIFQCNYVNKNYSLPCDCIFDTIIKLFGCCNNKIIISITPKFSEKNIKSYIN